jgi:hypothetical protein
MLNLNDPVTVRTPNGTFPGQVRRILPDYAWTGDTWYLVRGPEVETIARAGSIEAVVKDYLITEAGTGA